MSSTAASSTNVSLTSNKKRPHASVSSHQTSAHKSVVFLDPACPTYAGYVPRSSSSSSSSSSSNHNNNDTTQTTNTATCEPLDRVDVTTTTPQEFFARYVSQRRPCLLTGVIPMNHGPQVDLSTLWQQAGSVPVQVERRWSPTATFGQNRTASHQASMSVSQLLQLPLHELPHYYLSTQEECNRVVRGSGGDDKQEEEAKEDDDSSPNDDADDDDQDQLYSHAPLWQALAKHLDPLATRLTNALAGHLIRDSQHLWLGFASSSSCSGLHHDFHDNFNLVLHGRKEWILFPPTEYVNIPVYGTVQGLHGTNGLISYRNNPTRPDGVPLSLVLALQQQEEEDENDENDVNEGDDDDDEEEAVWGFGADYVSDVEDESSREDPNNNSSDVPNGDPDNHQTFMESKDRRVSPESEEAVSQRRPNSFSPVDLTLDARELAQRHPDFSPRGRIDVTVQAGEALYLPASWFHCVTSYSHDAPDRSTTTSTTTSTNSSSSSMGAEAEDATAALAAAPPYHMALNFWYHPPDQHIYEKPYRDNYWEKQQTTKTKKMKKK